MAIIRKRKTKQGFVYDIDFYYAGKRHIKSTGTSSQKLAREILAEIQSKIVRRTFNLEEYEKKNATITEFFDQYFTEAVQHKSPGTVRNERVYAERFRTIIGNQNLRLIDQRDMERWRNTMLRDYSPTTYNIERRTLQAAFNVAIRWKYLEQNPMKMVEKVAVEEKRRYMTKEELQSLFALIESDIANPRKKHLAEYNRV